MTGYTLAVFSDSCDYVHRFLAYCHEHDTPFDVYGFTDPQSLSVHLQRGGIDILLLPRDPEQTGITNHKSENNIGEIVYLGEQQDLDSSPKELFMYQPMADLLSDLETIAKASINRVLPSDPSETCILGIYVLDGDACAGELALLLADSPEYYGKRILYIDLDRFSGFAKEHDLSPKGNLSDLIYYYLTGSDVLASSLKDCAVRTGNMNYVAPPASGGDPDEIPLMQWRSFISSLAAAGSYSHVIINLRSNCRNIMHLFGTCRKIYLFSNSFQTAISGTPGFGYSNARAMAFHEYFVLNKRPDILQKLADGYGAQAELGRLLQNISSKGKKHKSRWKSMT